jgi:hypothetical protein
MMQKQIEIDVNINSQGIELDDIKVEIHDEHKEEYNEQQKLKRILVIPMEYCYIC